ncbi:MAG: prepilin-type N-terminal cleavage/methylation domain-containing protein [Armatimonadetes bacterium]|nr:prepilin-type N-terminal cleavage/methylation domain-containing protein [Armatimonadota bacterium]
MNGRPPRGFTLVEMIVVIAVIAILVAVAIRPLLRARKSSEESAALQVLRSLRSGEVRHKTRHDLYGDLNSLKASGDSPLGENETERASGYTFTSASGEDVYTIVAMPPRTDMTTFTLVESGTIYPTDP